MTRFPWCLCLLPPSVFNAYEMNAVTGTMAFILKDEPDQDFFVPPRYYDHATVCGATTMTSLRRGADSVLKAGIVEGIDSVPTLYLLARYGFASIHSVLETLLAATHLPAIAASRYALDVLLGAYEGPVPKHHDDNTVGAAVDWYRDEQHRLCSNSDPITSRVLSAFSPSEAKRILSDPTLRHFPGEVPAAVLLRHFRAHAFTLEAFDCFSKGTLRQVFAGLLTPLPNKAPRFTFKGHCADRVQVGPHTEHGWYGA